MEATLQHIGLKTYDQYIDLGVEWLGQIPEHWEILRMKRLFLDYSKKNKPNEELLSVTQGQGVIPRTWIKTRMVMPSGALESFKFIEKGDFAISLRSFEGGLEYCYHDGIISPAYTVLKRKREIVDEYYKFLFKSQAFISELQTSVVGIREGKNISFQELSYSYLPIPSLKEQKAIAHFLDDKTAKIDQAIAIKEKQIELLKERRQILIHQAVTCGLNENIKFKDSGVEWIGEIPEHWEVKKIKHILKERNERSKNGSEPLLMMSQTHGLVIRSEYHSKAEVAQTNEGNKVVKKNDLVFNKLKAHLGVFFKSNIEENGIVSPDYAVYYSKGAIKDLKFLELLFRNPEYIKQFICKATGIVEGLIRLYTADLFDIHLAIPPITEQQYILEYIENFSNKIYTSISLKEKEIEKLKEYKISLINSVVTGKVRVN